MSARHSGTVRPLRRVFDRATFAITAAYSAAWGLMLLNGGRYWDDWVMVGMTPETARLMGDMSGQPWQPYVWLFVSRVFAAEYILHALTFVLFLLCALVLNCLLRKTPGVTGQAQVLVPILFAVFPVNAARIAHIDFPYTLSLALFFLAWYLIVVDLERPTIWRKLVAAAMLAFGIIATNSLAAFIAVPIGHILWLRRAELRDASFRRRFALEHSYLVAVPVVTFVFKHYALLPWGIYEGYNAIQVITVLWAIWNIPEALWRSVLQPAWLGGALGVIVLLAGVLIYGRRDTSERVGRHRQYLYVLLLGLVIFAIGVFPYMAVGKMPQSVGGGWWDSRHQLLVPLGGAIVIYALAAWLVRALGGRRQVLTMVVLAMTVGFIVTDAGMLLDYQADWYKQVSLMRHMRESEDVRRGNYFIVQDDAVELNAVGRHLLPYEYTGMMYIEFGDATRFAWDEALGDNYAYQLGAYQKYHQYHWWAWEGPVRGYEVRIEPGTTDITRLPVLADLMWRDRFDPEGFEQRLYDVVNVETAGVDVELPK